MDLNILLTMTDCSEIVVSASGKIGFCKSKGDSVYDSTYIGPMRVTSISEAVE